MGEEQKSEGSGKLTNEALLKLSETEISQDKYSSLDRDRWNKLQDEARSERFKKDPYTFIEINEVICCAIRNPKSNLGISIFFGNIKRSEMDIAVMELNHMSNKRHMQMDLESQMKVEAATSMMPKHGMIDGARRLFKR